ncbi:MAG: MFS transporter [Rubrobacteraceae bacterium]
MARGTETTRLSVAGFVAIAVAFGPARNGFGLFLPDFREEFGLSVELSGFIASGVQAGYLFALAAVGLSVARLGPRPLVVLGGLAGALGMALVSFAGGILALASGVILAGTSAGWSWAPYNDAADRMVPPRLQGRVLSVVSTGTTFGILAAGVVALAAGSSWRAGWILFAAAAVVGVVLNVFVLPPGRHGSYDETSGNAPGRSSRVGWFARPESYALFTVAFSFGIFSAFYYAFAVDYVSRSGGLPGTAGPLFFIALGIAGFVGLFTGEAVSRFGLRRVLLAILVSQGISALLLGAAPAWWPGVAISAALFGADVMLMSALLAMWSSWVFAEQPSTGFSATLILLGSGSVVGPAALGAFAGNFGLGAAFLVAGAISLLTILIYAARNASPIPAKLYADRDPKA